MRGTVGTGPARARAGLQELRQAPDAAWQLEARGCGAATPRKRARAARPPPPPPLAGRRTSRPSRLRQPWSWRRGHPLCPHSPVLGAGPGSRVLPEAAEASRLQRHGAERPLHSCWFTSRQPAPGPTEDRAPRALCSFLWQCSRARARQGQRPHCPSFSHCHPDVLAGNLRPPKASRAAGPCGAHVWGMLRRVCWAHGNPSRLATGMLTGERHVKRERGCGSARLSPDREQSPPSDTSGWRGADRPGAVGLPAGRVPAPAGLEPTPRPVLPVGCVAQSRGQQARCPLVLPRFPCSLRGPLSGRQHGVESEDSPSRWAFGEPVTLLLEPGAVSSV